MNKKRQLAIKEDQLLLLRQQLDSMSQMEELLKWSLARCQAVTVEKGNTPELEDLDKFEALTARFVRFNDFLLLKIFRLVDVIDLEDEGSNRDRINRAEKKGLIDSASEFIEIRELRNSIGDEYQTVALDLIFSRVLEFAPVLLGVADKVRWYCSQYSGELHIGL